MRNFSGTYLQHIKHNMSFIDRLLTVLTPYECLGCTAEGDLLCAACIQQLTGLPERCYRCLLPSPDALTCPACRPASPLYRVRAGSAYSDAAKELVARLKFSGARASARLMAARLVSFVDTDSMIVPVPTATSRVRSRGYDQAKLLGRELSRQARLPYLDCLVRAGQTHQVGASRQQRLRQLSNAFRVGTSGKVCGRRILLVDDVVTTGATLESAALVLRAAGASRIEAAVFCAA